MISCHSDMLTLFSHIVYSAVRKWEAGDAPGSSRSLSGVFPGSSFSAVRNTRPPLNLCFSTQQPGSVIVRITL